MRWTDATAVIVDDIIGTAGTVANAAELLREGALSVRLAATHGVLAALHRPAQERPTR